jgi:hypothetical protein
MSLETIYNTVLAGNAKKTSRPYKRRWQRVSLPRTFCSKPASRPWPKWAGCLKTAKNSYPKC